ncbi:hypothetical protein [Chryseobacterium sp. HR92]|uniref:hypothetical protein n=1 Tax=Chryseobacterium sp. HR92 TaxID=3094839 RepID=UPI00388D858D|nr:hypothetical protein SFA27_10550 [Chryseobacterium sp. HR92]
MKKILFASTLALSILSCRENKLRQAPVVENAVDNAESSVSESIKKNTRYSSRSGNLVHEIYEELIKNDKSLQELDNRIENIQRKLKRCFQNIQILLVNQKHTIMMLLHYLAL